MRSSQPPPPFYQTDRADAQNRRYSASEGSLEAHTTQKRPLLVLHCLLMPTTNYYMRAIVTPPRGGPNQIVVVFDDQGDLISDWDESPVFPSGQRFSEVDGVSLHKAQVWIGKLRKG